MGGFSILEFRLSNSELLEAEVAGGEIENRESELEIVMERWIRGEPSGARAAQHEGSQSTGPAIPRAATRTPAGIYGEVIGGLNAVQKTLTSKQK
jgi:hypothetical protein